MPSTGRLCSRCVSTRPASPPAAMAAQRRAPSRPRSTAMATAPAVGLDAGGGRRGRRRRSAGRTGSAASMRARSSARGVERDEVGLGEVAVVVGVLLHPEGAGAAGGLVPVAGLLADGLARLEQVDLAERLVVDGPAERAQRVEVLDLAAGAPGLAGAVDRHVGVDPHRPLLHLGVGHAGGQEDRAQLDGVLLGLLGGAHVGLGHDLDQRDAGAVVVDEAVAGVVDATAAADVVELAGVLLDVGPGDADPQARRQVEVAGQVGRQVVLGDLVVLRLVRVEVVLPGEHRAVAPRSCSARPSRIASSTACSLSTGSEPGRPRQVGQVLVLGSSPKWLGQRAEQLRGGGELAVDLEPDHHLPAVGQDRRASSWLMRGSARGRRPPGTWWPRRGRGP